MSPKVDESMIQGMVAPGFERVKEAFIRNFKERGDVGAAVAAYRNNEKIVDLWGGYRDVKNKAPWDENTLVNVFSSTKGVSSLAVAVAHSRGLIDYDEKVSTYWPEFAQNGKETITLRQLLSHQAGLCAIDEPLNLEILSDLDKLAGVLAQQKPGWEPGTKHGYHAITLGWYEGELIRRVDPQKRTLGQFFQDEVAKPLDIEFYIGLPEDIPDSRLANIYAPFFLFRMLFNIGKMPKEFVKAFVLSPKSLTARSFNNPKFLANPLNYNLRKIRALELPAANGHGTARSIAKAYGALAAGGSELGLKPETLKEMTAPAIAPSSGTLDQILKLHTSFSLGYSRPSPDFQFGSNAKAFGTAGAGGSFGFADPDAGLGFSYVMTNMGFYIFNDPREKILRDTLYTCLGY